MIDLATFRLVDDAGRPMATDRLRIVGSLRGSDERPRWALRIHDGQRDLFLKVRVWRSLRQRVRATLGRSYIMNEVALRRRMTAAGIRVPALAGWGRRRSGPLVNAEALLLEWLGDYVPMSEIVAAAGRSDQRGDSDDLARAQLAMAALLGQVRRAGLADKDFGIHNLMLRRGALAGAKGDVPVWTDLERVYAAEPDEPEATAQTVAAALARWWLAIPEPSALQSAATAIQQAAPAPRSGWPALASVINAIVTRRVDHSQTGRKQPPPAIAFT